VKERDIDLMRGLGDMNTPHDPYFGYNESVDFS
jgi:hypothetical protein